MDYQLVVDIFTELLRRCDPYNHHGPRVATLTKEILRRAGRTTKEDMELIAWGAAMHDIGKVLQPHQYWLEPRPLNENEMAVMKTHVTLGLAFGAAMGFPASIMNVIGGHHENWDGSGYPLGLKGHEISEGARAIRIADTYDAITATRPYRKARSSFEAVEDMNRHAHQYDPILYTFFLEYVREMER